MMGEEREQQKATGTTDEKKGETRGGGNWDLKKASGQYCCR